MTANETPACALCGGLQWDDSQGTGCNFTWCDNSGCPLSVITMTHAQWDKVMPLLAAFILDREREAFQAGQNSVDRFGDVTDTFDDWQKERGK